MNQGQLMTATVAASISAILYVVSAYFSFDLKTAQDYNTYFLINIFSSGVFALTFWFFRKLVINLSIQGIRLFADVMLGIYVLRFFIEFASYSELFSYDFYDIITYFHRLSWLIMILFYARIAGSNISATPWLRIYSGISAVAAMLVFVVNTFPSIFSLNRDFVGLVFVIASVVLPIVFYQEYVHFDDIKENNPDILDSN